MTCLTQSGLANAVAMAGSSSRAASRSLMAPCKLRNVIKNGFHGVHVKRGAMVAQFSAGQHVASVHCTMREFSSDSWRLTLLSFCKRLASSRVTSARTWCGSRVIALLPSLMAPCRQNEANARSASKHQTAMRRNTWHMRGHNAADLVIAEHALGSTTHRKCGRVSSIEQDSCIAIVDSSLTPPGGRLSRVSS